MEELINRKDYLLRMCQLLYKEFIIGENVYVDDLRTDLWLYERVFGYIDNKLGHKDTDISDFIYACFYENTNKYGPVSMKTQINTVKTYLIFLVKM
jgi:hypothetical protein